MSDEALYSAGLSGDLGWNEAETPPLTGLATAVLLVTTSAYWGVVWLLSGLPPLASFASRAQDSRTTDLNANESEFETKWSCEQV